MSESTPPKKTTKQFKSCLFEVSKLPVESFRQPADGRKWKAAASARKTLTVQLAAFADADGSSIRPSTQTLAIQTGFSRRKVCYLLDDLKELGFMERIGRLGQKGPAIRRLKLPEKPSNTPAETPSLEARNSIPESATLDSESAGFDSESARFNPESATAVAHNLPLHTSPTDPPSKPVRKAEELRHGMVSAFSKARPDENLNWTGFADIEALADEWGSDAVLKVWRRWLKNRDTSGMKFHFRMFRKEFETARTDLERIEREKKAKEEEWAAICAADTARTRKEIEAFKLKRAAEEAETKRQADLFKETGVPY